MPRQLKRSPEQETFIWLVIDHQDLSHLTRLSVRALKVFTN